MYRFSIRDLLALVLLCAVAAGWWADHRHQQFMLQRQIEQAKREKSQLESALSFLRAYDIQPRRASPRE